RLSCAATRGPQREATRERLQLGEHRQVLALKPHLVLTFSDLQADIAADLIRRGLDVHAFNQRSVAGILDMIRTLGAMLDVSEQARQLVGMLEARLAEARSRADRLPKRPKVFF